MYQMKFVSASDIHEIIQFKNQMLMVHRKLGSYKNLSLQIYCHKVSKFKFPVVRNQTLSDVFCHVFLW